MPTLNSRILKAEVIVIGGWIFWLWIAVFLVGIEMYDGWGAISNARSLAGAEGGYYSPMRAGPFYSLFFVPFEWIRLALGLDGTDLRPFHFLTAAIHSVYVLGTWLLLRRRFGSSFYLLIVFVSVVTNPMFALWAGFRSTDIFPGLILLAMVLLGQKYLRAEKRLGLFFQLFALGLLAALLKSSAGGLVWLSCFASVVFSKDRSFRAIFELVGAAVLGAICFWFVDALVLQLWRDDLPLWRLPLEQIRLLSEDSFIARGDLYSFSAWFSNIWVFGIAGLVLLLLGGRAAFKGSVDDRAVLVAWLAFFLLSLTNRAVEIRYLSPLVPLTAWLAMLAIPRLKARKATVIGFLILATLDISVSLWTASSYFDPFFRRGAYLPLVEELKNVKGPIRMTGYLSSVLPRYAPIRNDPYHGVAHTSPLHIAAMLDRPSKSLQPSDENTIQRVLRDSNGALLLCDPLLVYASDLSLNAVKEHRVMLAKSDFVPATEAVVVGEDGKTVEIRGKAQSWNYLFLDLEEKGIVALPPAPNGQGFLVNGKFPDDLEGVKLRGARVALICDGFGDCQKTSEP